jgi:hypothetical protein
MTIRFFGLDGAADPVQAQEKQPQAGDQFVRRRSIAGGTPTG